MPDILNGVKEGHFFQLIGHDDRLLIHPKLRGESLYQPALRILFVANGQFSNRLQ